MGDIDDLKFVLGEEDKFTYENDQSLGYSRLKFSPEAGLGTNEGGEFQFKSLYCLCFLHFYPVLEQKIRKYKKKQKIVKKIRLKFRLVWLCLDANALSSLDANAQVLVRISPSSSSDHRLSSVLS